MSRINSIGVLGAGAWGTALALVAARAGRQVVLWGRDADGIADLEAHRENRRRLPGIALDPAITSSAAIGEALACDALILAVPAQTLREVARSMTGLAPRRPVVIAAKGLDRQSGAFLVDVLSEVVPQAIPAVLSGPSFAADVARGLPTAVTLACADDATGRALVDALGQAAFRPYRSTDVTGAQVGGAVKNVLAIACGAVAGRDLGASAGAALIARGFAEMNRFATALGARPETLAGLSGLGDLVLTATSAQSRNFALGVSLGRTGHIDRSADAPLTEGVWAAPSVVARAAALGIEMPISAAVGDLVAGGIDVDDAVARLLSRPFRAEA